MKKLCLMLSVVLLISCFATPYIFAEEVEEISALTLEETLLSEDVVEDNKAEEIAEDEGNIDEINEEANTEVVEETEIEAAAVTETTIVYDGSNTPTPSTDFSKYNKTTLSGLSFDMNDNGVQKATGDVAYHVYGTSSVDDNGYWKFAFNKTLSGEENFIKQGNYFYSADLYFPSTEDSNVKSEFIVSIGSGVDKTIGTSKTMCIVFRAGEYKNSDSNFGNSGFVFYGLEKDRWHNVVIDFEFDGANLEYNVYIDGVLATEHYRYSKDKDMYKVNGGTIIPTAYASKVSSWYFLSRSTLKFVTGEKHNFYFDNVIYKNTAYTPANIPTIESAVDGVVTVDEGKSAADIAALTTNASKTEVYRYNSTSKTYTFVTDAVATGDIVKLVSLGGAYNYYQVSVNAAAPVPPAVNLPVVEGSVLVKDFDFELNTYDADIKISAPVYKKGDTILDGNIAANDVINVSLSGTNEGSSKELYLVSALYDENNTMLYAGYDFKDETGDFELLASLKSPLDLTKGNYNIKTFLWDSVDASYIYTDNFDISKNGGVNFASYGWNLTDYSYISPKDKFTGRNALEIVSGTNSDKFISQEVELDKNDIYKVVFASKGDAGFMYDVMDNDFASSLAGGAKTFQGNEDWDLSSVVFESKDNNKVNLVFKQGNGTSKAFVDNVVITKSLISNGNFESGKSGFTFDKDNDINAENALDGTNAGYIKSGKVIQDISLIAGYDYKLVFYSKGAKVTAKILDESDIEVAKKEFDESISYRYNALTFKAPVGKKEFTVEFLADSDAYIDCVSLEKKPLNLIENAEFKYGITDLWSVSDKTRGNLSAVKEGDEYVAKFSNRTANWVRLEHNISDAINQAGSGKYKLSFDIKYVNEADSNSKLELYLFYTNDGKIYNSYANITDEWTTIEQEYDITDEMVFSDEKGNISLGTGTGVTADFMIKNIKLVKVNE